MIKFLASKLMFKENGDKPINQLMTMDKLFTVLIALLLSAGCFAQDDDFDDLALNGLASYEQLRKEYYIGAIYLESISQNPAAVITMDGKKRMEIRITIDKWSPRRFAQQWNQAILINNDQITLEDYADQIADFVNLPQDDLIAGDRLFIDKDPDSGVKVYINGKLGLSTSDEGFFDVLASTWIGLRPPSSEFKQNILVLPTDQAGTDLLLRYEAISPSDDRKKTVAGWFKREQKKVAAKPKPKKAPTQTKVTSKAAPKPAPIQIETPAAPVVAKPKPTVNVEKPKIAKAAPAPAPKPEPKPAPAPAKPEPKPTPTPAVAKAEPKPAAPAKDEAAEAEKAAQAKLLRRYRSSVMKLTYLNTQYPKRAMDNKQEGLVVIELTLDRKGKVKNVEVKQETQYRSLNRAAKTAVSKSGPYPEPPKELKGDNIVLELPFNFKL